MRGEGKGKEENKERRTILQLVIDTHLYTMYTNRMGPVSPTLDQKVAFRLLLKNVIFGINATSVGLSLIQCSSRSCKSHGFLALLLAENLGETMKLRDRAHHCTSHSGHTHCHLFNFRRELDLKNLNKGVDVYCIQYIHMLYLDTTVNLSVLTIRKPWLIYIFRAFPCCTLTMQTYTHTCMAQEHQLYNPLTPASLENIQA